MTLWCALARGGTLVVIAAVAAPAGELHPQETPDALVPVSSLELPDSVPLTRVAQLVAGVDGSVFLIDEQTAGVLAFDPDGVFRHRIGRPGEGPGELRSPWRLGLLGRDTLWVVDTRRRVNLYDVSTGASLADFGPSAWASAADEGFRPFAVLAGHSILAVRWEGDDGLAEVRTHRFAGRRIDPGVARAPLDVRDRLVVVPLAAGGSGLRFRNPFSFADMLAVDARGRCLVRVRRPRPDGQNAFFTLEAFDAIEGRTRSLDVPYAPRPLENRDVRAWAEALGPVREMVDMRLFPSHAAGVDAVLDALDEPEFHSPVQNLGRGLVDEAVLVDPGGGVWLRVPDGPPRPNLWLVVTGEEGASHVSAPDDMRLLAVQGDRAWGEVRDGFGVPTVRVYQRRRTTP